MCMSVSRTEPAVPSHEASRQASSTAATASAPRRLAHRLCSNIAFRIDTSDTPSLRVETPTGGVGATLYNAHVRVRVKLHGETKRGVRGLVGDFVEADVPDGLTVQQLLAHLGVDQTEVWM